MTQALSRQHITPLVATLFLTWLLAACGPTVPPYEPPLVDPGPTNPAIDTADAVLRASAGMPPRIQRAREGLRLAESQATVGRILDGIDPDGPEVLAAAARLAYADGRFDEGLALFERATDGAELSAELLAEHASLLVDAGRYAMARDIAFDGLDLYPDDAALIAAADRAFDEDPALGGPVLTLEPDVQLDVLKALGGGSTVTLKAKKGDDNVAAIKPDQDLGQSMYRSEIAYFRLCALLRCTFRVPYNGHVRISRRDFETLYGRVDSDKQRGYATKFGHLTWKQEDGDEYLHATWKGWVPEFTGFPIEATGAWTKWLQAGSTRDLSERVTDWLPTLAELGGPRGWSRHSRRMDYAVDMTMDQLIGQISDQLVVDFLTNNWDRFSGDPELYGANCHIEPGGLVAIDNGASFPPWHTKRVVRRLYLAQRFRRPLINAIRRLDHDKTFERLFPDANTDETKRFEIFWERRQELLDYVDGLVERHGEAAVYLDDAETASDAASDAGSDTDAEPPPPSEVE